MFCLKRVLHEDCDSMGLSPPTGRGLVSLERDIEANAERDLIRLILLALFTRDHWRIYLFTALFSCLDTPPTSECIAPV